MGNYFRDAVHVFIFNMTFPSVEFIDTRIIYVGLNRPEGVK